MSVVAERASDELSRRGTGATSVGFAGTERTPLSGGPLSGDPARRSTMLAMDGFHIERE
jgi:hypothetical protein